MPLNMERLKRVVEALDEEAFKLVDDEGITENEEDYQMLRVIVSELERVIKKGEHHVTRE